MKFKIGDEVRCTSLPLLKYNPSLKIDVYNNWAAEYGSIGEIIKIDPRSTELEIADILVTIGRVHVWFESKYLERV